MCTFFQTNKNNKIIILKVAPCCEWRSYLPLFANRLCTHALLSRDGIWPHLESWPQQRRTRSSRRSMACVQRLVGVVENNPKHKWSIECYPAEVIFFLQKQQKNDIYLWYWVVLISLTRQASDRLDECKRFESSWINAVNLCKMAAEAACTSGEYSWI